MQDGGRLELLAIIILLVDYLERARRYDTNRKREEERVSKSKSSNIRLEVETIEISGENLFDEFFFNDPLTQVEWTSACRWNSIVLTCIPYELSQMEFILCKSCVQLQTSDAPWNAIMSMSCNQWSLFFSILIIFRYRLRHVHLMRLIPFPSSFENKLRRDTITMSISDLSM